MQLLSLSSYNDLIKGAKALTSECVGGQIWPKVLLLENQSILKLFRLKRLLTSARLVPYTTRFQHHVKMLKAVNIPTVDINAVYDIAAINRTAVLYRPLEGQTLRDYCKYHSLTAQLASQLGVFFQFLHFKGIYFRSIHFGNMVLTPDERIGLIDVVDMRFRKGPLNSRLRIRNLRHLFRYDEDIACLAPVRQIFINTYCQSARMRSHQENRLRRHFEGYFSNGSVSQDQAV